MYAKTSCGLLCFTWESTKTATIKKSLSLVCMPKWRSQHHMVCWREWGQSLCSICLTFIKTGNKKSKTKKKQPLPSHFNLSTSFPFTLWKPFVFSPIAVAFLVNSTENKTKCFWSDSRIAWQISQCHREKFPGLIVRLGCCPSTVQRHVGLLRTKDFWLLWVICEWGFLSLFSGFSATCSTTGRRSWWLEEALHRVSSIIIQPAALSPLTTPHTQSMIFK